MNVPERWRRPQKGLIWPSFVRAHWFSCSGKVDPKTDKSIVDTKGGRVAALRSAAYVTKMPTPLPQSELLTKIAKANRSCMYLDWRDLIRTLKVKDFVPDNLVSQNSKYGG